VIAIGQIGHAGRTERALIGQTAVEFLHAAVDLIGHVDVARRIHRHVRWMVKLVVAGPGRASADRGLVGPCGPIKELYPVVIKIGHIDAIRIHGHSHRPVKVVVVRAGLTRHADGRHIVVAAVKDLHAVIASVGHVETITAVNGDVARRVEVSIVQP
jgi:hypothetical protein